MSSRVIICRLRNPSFWPNCRNCVIERRSWRVGPLEEIVPKVRRCKSCEGSSVLRIEFYRLFKERARFTIVFLAELEEMPHAPHPVVVRVEVWSFLVDRSLCLGEVQRGAHRSDDGFGDLILDLEDVSEVTVVRLRPHVGASVKRSLTSIPIVIPSSPVLSFSMPASCWASSPCLHCRPHGTALREAGLLIPSIRSRPEQCSD
jgi:hypothetical protein